MADDHIKTFVEEYGPVAVQVSKQTGIDPSVLLAQWGLETSYGRSITGAHNLGNIKDVSGYGTEATDNQTKKKAKYLNFESPEAFGDYYAHSLHRLYPEALNTGSDIPKFSEGLRKGKLGSYAEDPDYEKKITSTYGLVTPFYKPPEENTSNGNFYSDLEKARKIREEEEKKSNKTVPDIIPEVGAGVGAYAAYKGGVGVPNLLSPGANVFSAAPQNITPPQKITAPQNIIPNPEAGLTSGEKWSNKTGYGFGKGTTRESVENYNRAKSHGSPNIKTEKLYGVTLPNEPADLYQRNLLRIKVREAAEKAAVAEAAAAEKAAAAEAAAAAKAEKSSRLFGKLQGVGRVGLGALGGYSSAKDIYDLAVKNKKEGLSLYDSSQGLSALGGLAMMMGSAPATIAGGLALQGGLAAGDYLYDKFQLPIANALDTVFPTK